MTCNALHFSFSGVAGSPEWNFWKYLFDHKGKLINYFNSYASEEILVPMVKEAVENAQKVDDVIKKEL